MTYPLILPAERAPELRPVLTHTLSLDGEGAEYERCTHEVLATLVRTGSLEDCRLFADARAASAVEQLRILPDSAARTALETVAQAAVDPRPMIVTLEDNADAHAVRRLLTERGLWVQRFDGLGGGDVQLYVEAHSAAIDPDELRRLPGVAQVATRGSEHPRLDEQPAVVDVAGVLIGGQAAPVLMAGPCAVESQAQIEELTAQLVAAHSGITFLRGGAYKPRTSPYSFAGHGVPALAWIRRAADAHGLRVVTEVLAPADVEVVAAHADLVQIGTRNMQNFALLHAVAQAGRPVLLKRGMAATVDEWLAAGEHLRAHGCPAVIFCERGVRGFDSATRNLFDVSAVALMANRLSALSTRARVKICPTVRARRQPFVDGDNHLRSGSAGNQTAFCAAGADLRATCAAPADHYGSRGRRRPGRPA